MFGRGLELKANIDYSDIDRWFSPMLGEPTRAGPTVNEEESLTISAVFRAVDLLASHLAMLPLPVFRQTGPASKERDLLHPLHQVLNIEPNDDMSAMAWKRATHANTLLYNNGYTEIQRLSSLDGSQVKLWPITSRLVTPRRDDATGAVVYEIRIPGKDVRTIPAANMLHFSGLGLDGLMGVPLIAKMARENLGLALAIERYASAFFGNNTQLGVVLSAPGTMSKPVVQANMEAWNSAHGGADRAFKTTMMQGGIKVEKVGAQNDHAELIEVQRWSIRDVSRWFNVPPFMLSELGESANLSNVEQQALHYTKWSLTPWVVTYQQELNRKLIPRRDWGKITIEFILEGILRGDVASRTAYYTVMRETGMTPNQILALENFNSAGPVGDIHMASQQMTTMEALATQATTNSQPPTTSAQRALAMNGGGQPEPDDNNNPDDETVEASPADAPDANGMAKLRSQIADAHKPLVASVLVRMWRIEIKAASRKVKSQKGGENVLADWAESFYPDHMARFRDALIPPMEALGGAIRATLPDTILDVKWEGFMGMQTKNATEAATAMSRGLLESGRLDWDVVEQAGSNAECYVDGLRKGAVACCGRN